jgi:hypothetical protein
VPVGGTHRFPAVQIAGAVQPAASHTPWTSSRVYVVPRQSVYELFSMQSGCSLQTRPAPNDSQSASVAQADGAQ